MANPELESFADAVYAGKFSMEELREINTMVVENIKLERSRKVAQTKRYLSIGDKVRIFGLKGKNLNGQIVIVEKINKTRIVTTVPGMDEITIPISCVTKV